MNQKYVKSSKAGGAEYNYYDIKMLSEYNKSFDKLPYSIRILAESLIRNFDGTTVTEDHLKHLCSWNKDFNETVVIPYFPGRVLMQDFTGVPGVVDLAVMRDALKIYGLNPGIINPTIPVDLVIDHSVQVDDFGNNDALQKNIEMEYERNNERYSVLKWGQSSFSNFNVVPPNSGICHQINLEYLSSLTLMKDGIAYPDTLIGTDSHTPMINSLGIMAWGVGGIEAEAVMLGQPYYMKIPQVIGVRLTGSKKANVTATDIVLTITERLRKYGVVEKFLEFFGSGMESIGVTDRATIANMTPEFGATLGFFPVDDKTIDYFRMTCRDEKADLAKDYYKNIGLYYDPSNDIEYSEVLEIDLSAIKPSIAGPSRPQDRLDLDQVKEIDFNLGKSDIVENTNSKNKLENGNIVIAAITSCTSTSNAQMMFGTAILARNAVKCGLTSCDYVKTSFAPGSRVVEEYLKQSDLLGGLEALGFHIVGFGCTTCIGNSGPLSPEIDKEIKERNLNVASILSGNRNFEARIHPTIESNFLASPLLVVAFAIAGRINFDFEKEPLGITDEGKKIYLKDIWPTEEEINQYVNEYVKKDLFKSKYENIFEGYDRWKKLAIMAGETYHWERESTYIRKPSFFDNFSMELDDLSNVEGARILMLLGDSVTTDHISPAGAISTDTPAAKYLKSEGKKPAEYNTYGSRRGNHEVMVRGTFANVRIKNKMVAPKIGGFSIKYPENEIDYLYYIATRYKDEKVPLVVFAGKEYGTGSSRDWAAKGTSMLGVKAVVAESYERIHKSNLIGMGVLPLQFLSDENYESHGITGSEVIDIDGIEDITPGKILDVKATKESGEIINFKVKVRLDTSVDVEYYKHGGILQYVLRDIIRKN